MPTLAERCKKHILDNGLQDFVAKYTTIGAINTENDEMRIRCPAHNDENPSASMRLTDGIWKCFVPSCDASGDLVSFYAFANQLPEGRETVRRLGVELCIIPDIPEARVEQFQKILLLFPNAIAGISNTLGISEKTIRKFQLGMMERSTQEENEVEKSSKWFITIPIRGPSGAWEDIRLYNKRLVPKIRSYIKGSGKPKIFPLEVLIQNNTVVLFEGEKDCLRAHDLGITNAITVTGSAGTMPGNYRDLFQGKVVYVCFDIDKAGKIGASRIVSRFNSVVKELYIIDLPTENLPENGDLSDWTNLGHTISDFQELIANARKVETKETHGTVTANPSAASDKKDDRQDTNSGAEPAKIDFRDISTYKSFKSPVTFLAHTIGVSASMKSYAAPSTVEITCPRNMSMCSGCHVNQIEDVVMPVRMSLNHSAEQSLELIRVTARQKGQTIKKLCGIPEKCNRCTFNETERSSIQQIILTPPTGLGLGRVRDFYSDFRPAFYQGSQLPDNHDYWFTGYVQSDPKTQEMTVNCYHAHPARNAVEGFKINADTFLAIDWFCLKQEETIEDHFRGLHQIIENDIGIYGRHNIQHAVLESIFSVLEFHCGDKHIQNGWVENLIIGDTRTGKSKTAEKIMQMIEVGEMISCENASLAGLVGGIEYIEGMPIPVWGAFPRNNGGFMVLDEVDALSTREGQNIAGQLSAMRSSGVAQIQKIVQASAQARVRTVWITNPRDGAKVSGFNGGINAITGIIPNRQDIARFTKAYAVRDEDVSVETVTNVRPRIADPKIKKFWNTLAILTWSLRSDQIQFTVPAQLFLKQMTRRVIERYHDSIPLVEKGSMLDKLAKLAVPVAVLCGSFKFADDTIHLLVDERHCQYAVAHLFETYDSEAMGYNDYSVIEHSRSNIVNVDEIRDAFLHSTNLQRRIAHSILSHLLTAPTVNSRYFDELCGLPMTSKGLWGIMLRNNCLQMMGTNNGAMQKTPAFVPLIKSMLAELKVLEEKEYDAGVIAGPIE